MRKKLGEVLREAGLIDELQLESALSHQRTFGGQLGRILIDSGFLGEQQLVETLSRMLGVPRVELSGRTVSTELLALVPLDFAEKFHTVPVALRAEAKGDHLFVAMSDPTNLEAVDTLQFRTGKRVVPMIATESDVEGAIRRWYYGERPREVTASSLENVQFHGREVEARPSDFEDIPIITGSELADAPPAAPPPAASADWFLAVEGPAQTPPEPPEQALAPAQPTMPAPAAATPLTHLDPHASQAIPTLATQNPATSSPFAVAPPAPPASPAASGPPELPTQQQPTSSPFVAAPGPHEQLFGAPNSFLGGDDDMGLGQQDLHAPPPMPAPSLAAPPMAAPAEGPELLPDDALVPLPDDALTPLPDDALMPLPDDALVALPPPGAEEASAPSTPPAPQAPPAAPAAEASLPVAQARPDDDAVNAAELGPIDAMDVVALELDEEDDTPIEFVSAAEMLQDAPSTGVVERSLALPDPSGEDRPIELATAAELAQMDFSPPAPSSSDGSATSDVTAELSGNALRAAAEALEEMQDFEDLSDLTDLAAARLSALDAATFEADVTMDLDIHDTGFGAPRPLPPPGGVVPDSDEVESDAPIQVVNMPPDRSPVDFAGEVKTFSETVDPPQVDAPFGDDLLEVSESFDDVFDVFASPSAPPAAPEAPSSGPTAAAAPPATPEPAPEAPVAPSTSSPPNAPNPPSTEPVPAQAAAPVEPAAEEESFIEVTEDYDLTDLSRPRMPPLTAHQIHELERLHHDGTTTLSSAGVVDTPERVAGGVERGEVMTLALPTPAYSHAALVDAPWRLAGEPPPAGQTPDVPLAPYGLSTARLSSVDDVDVLVPPALLAQLEAERAAAREAEASVAVPLPGAASPSIAQTTPATSPRELPWNLPGSGGVSPLDELPGAPDTVPLSELPPEDDDEQANLADAWRDAAEQQLLERKQPDELVVPEHRRMLDAPEPGPLVEAPKPVHPYTPSAPSSLATDRPPWAALANGRSSAPAPADERAPPPAFEEAALVTPSVTPLPVDDWSAALGDAATKGEGEETPPNVPLPSATPRSVLVADAVQLGDDPLTPESSPPAAAPAAPAPSSPTAPEGVSFTPTPTMITSMSPEQLRALAERLVQRGALTADDIDAARQATPPHDDE